MTPLEQGPFLLAREGRNLDAEEHEVLCAHQPALGPSSERGVECTLPVLMGGNLVLTFWHGCFPAAGRTQTPPPPLPGVPTTALP